MNAISNTHYNIKQIINELNKSISQTLGLQSGITAKQVGLLHSVGS